MGYHRLWPRRPRGPKGIPPPPLAACLIIFGLLLIFVTLCTVAWRLLCNNEERAFLNQRALNSTWRATHRLLAATIPAQVLPKVFEQVATYLDWSGAAATTEADVTIIFVRFPPLSNTVFPRDAAAAIAHLNSLLALCHTTASRLGVTTLEVTNTDFVGVVGLRGGNGNDGTGSSTSNDASAPAPAPASAHEPTAAVRAGLAIIASLPQEFAALAAVGINTGPVSAGFVGTLRPRFTLIGDTMSTASRMASIARPGRMTVSAATHARITASFETTQRETYVKGSKGATLVFDVAKERVDGGGGVAAQVVADTVAVSDSASVSVEAQAASVLAPLQPASDLSTLFPPLRFTLAGFVDGDAEARFREQRVSRPTYQLLIGLLFLVSSFILINLGEDPKIMWRFYLIIFSIVSLSATLFASVIAPNLFHLQRLATLSLVGSAILAPIASQMFEPIAFASAVLIFLPNHSLTTAQQTAIQIIRPTLVTALQVSGYYTKPS